MRSSNILVLAWALSCSAAILPACGVCCRRPENCQIPKTNYITRRAVSLEQSRRQDVHQTTAHVSATQSITRATCNTASRRSVVLVTKLVTGPRSSMCCC